MTVQLPDQHPSSRFHLQEHSAASLTRELYDQARSDPSINRPKDPNIPPMFVALTPKPGAQEVAPDSVQPLPHGTLPCAICGVAVAPPHQAQSKVLVSAAWVRDPTMADGQRIQHDYQDVAKCPDCLPIVERARLALAAHPGILARRGDVAREQLLFALAAADAISFAVTLDTGQAVTDVINLLHSSGQAHTWRAREYPGQCATDRWSFLPPSARQSIRTSAAALLASRVAKPRAIYPPSTTELRGCLLCGVRSVPGYPGQKLWSWHKFTSRSLGGKPDAGGPEDLLVGYTCPQCEKAIDFVGSIGPSALTAALRAHLDIPRHARNQPILVGVKAWAATSPRPEPSAVPWEFLAEDLATATKLLD